MNPTVEHKLAIRAFDYVAALAIGAAAAVVAWWVVPDSLPGVLEMALGMVIGLITAVPLLAAFMVVLGGFEILMMSTQIGMVAGMAAPMIQGGTWGSVALAGAGIGLVVQLVLRALDRSLHGEVVT